MQTLKALAAAENMTMNELLTAIEQETANDFDELEIGLAALGDPSRYDAFLHIFESEGRGAYEALEHARKEFKKAETHRSIPETGPSLPSDPPEYPNYNF